MTLVLGGRSPITEPRTHVLIIGVGSYPNAAQPRASTLSTLLGVTQLTSPSRSARAIADWFLTQFQNRKTNLGSVDMLLSEKDPKPYRKPKGDEFLIERADFTNISRAFRDWETRCDSNKANVAVFYFCGHGAQGANRVLLPDDFPVLHENGEPDWSKVVDFSATRAEMEFCQAAHQFFFLDCCRGVTLRKLISQPLGTALVTRRLSRSITVLAQHVYAIPEGLVTGGRNEEISAFTNLLLHSLRGAAAQKSQGIWQVKGYTLLEAFNRLAEAFQEDGLEGSVYPPIQLDQSAPTRENPVLHQYSNEEPPLIPIRIRCSPEAAASGATYAASNATYTIQLLRHKMLNYGYGFLSPGSHTFQVTFPAGGWTSDDQQREVEPPVCEYDFIARNV